MSLEAFRAELRAKLEEDPANPGLRFSYGSALAAAGRFAGAAAEYRAALELKPEWPEAQNNLGIVYLEQGRLAAAAALFEEILRAAPESAPARNNLGLVRAKQGSPAEAAACFRAALAADPGFEKAAANLERALDTSGYYLGESEPALYPPEISPPEPAAPAPAGTESAAPAPAPPRRKRRAAARKSAAPKKSAKPRRRRRRAGDAAGADIPGLLKYLKDLTGALPGPLEDEFLRSDARLSLECIINTMEGKKGLLREISERTPEAAGPPAAATARPAAAFAAAPRAETARDLTGTLSYLKGLTNTLPDDTLACVLKQKVENIMEMMQL